MRRGGPDRVRAWRDRVGVQLSEAGGPEGEGEEKVMSLGQGLCFFKQLFRRARGQVGCEEDGCAAAAAAGVDCGKEGAEGAGNAMESGVVVA